MATKKKNNLTKEKLLAEIERLKKELKRGKKLAWRSRKKEEDVESYGHETETRKNAVPVGLASYDTLS